MASNQHRPRTRLSLRSNTIPYGSMSSEQPDSDASSMPPTSISKKRAYVAVAVLCYVNLLNYMDRYTIAGVLLSIQNYFGIPDSTSGLLQTGLLDSGPDESLGWDRRSQLFHHSTYYHSGLGYIMGATIASATGDWRWALRVSPALGGLGLLLLVFLIPNPPRGASDTQGGGTMESTSYIEDVKYLLKNRSFVWSSLGVTAMAFVTGALAFWTPTFLSRAQVTQGLRPPCEKEPCNSLDSYIFGAITVVTGIVGVFLGTWISKQLRDKVPNADPLICAVGMLSSSPCFFIAVILAATSIPVTYTFIAIGETLLSLNWAILADILLYVVVPTRRATAEALQIMVCHLLGDAGSPYLIGAISDALRKYNPESPRWDFRRLEYSILLCPVIGVLGGLFFLMTSLYIKEDRKAAELLASGNNRLL
ncbi:hypothetical protein H4Q32_002939 [Labeo rohita]|uniref:Spinster-like protein n=1 Tax=Labeo rohita TaxID=84645 RepID=A0ABQ8MS01_LABRO|nr:hypothetical protein H4Q32_002939 [Labeo rohita]